MGARTGSADLPLHGGRVPEWLATRMARLGRVIVEAIVFHYGRDEVLRRLSHPFWFQSFGAVMGMDWHSSGITTSVLGALKGGLAPVSDELGLYVCGGRGRHSRKTPEELTLLSQRLSLDGEGLVRASRLVAKIDSAAVQDGFQLYLHGFIVSRDGAWTVVQQGMNADSRQARRYHWLSESVGSFVDSPHTAIDGKPRGVIVNLADRRAAASRDAQLGLLAEGPDVVLDHLRRLARDRARAPARGDATAADHSGADERRAYDRWPTRGDAAAAYRVATDERRTRDRAQKPERDDERIRFATDDRRSRGLDPDERESRRRAAHAPSPAQTMLPFAEVSNARNPRADERGPQSLSRAHAARAQQSAVQEALPHLQLPAHHEVTADDVVLRRLHGTLAAAAERGPKDFPELLLTPGVGARTVEALASVAEVVHGTPCRFSDPARFSLAHGGKDGHPFPVPLKVYDQTLRVLKDAVEKAKLGNDDRLEALRRLDAQARRLEAVARGPSFDAFLENERANSHRYGGRTVFGEAEPPEESAAPASTARRAQPGSR